MLLDARGKACPQPVVLALRALSERQAGEALDVLVDDEVAVQNLQRMAAQKNCTISVTPEVGYFTVQISGASDVAVPEPTSCNPAADCGSKVVAVGADTMGRGNEELGHVLLKGFLYALAQMETVPRTVLFFNGGAKLTVEGSESLEDLRELERRGTEILTCGTCLDYYRLKEHLAVGGVTNMYQIAETLTHADGLVTI